MSLNNQRQPIVYDALRPACLDGCFRAVRLSSYPAGKARRDGLVITFEIRRLMELLEIL
jgi:hypothetical protein